MKTRKSVTLLELLIVVVIVGVLATSAVPTYNGVIRRARISKALNAMALITQAEKIAQIESGGFIDTESPNLNNTIGAAAPDIDCAADDATTCQTGINLSSIDSDEDWDYEVDGNTITATGRRGPIEDGEFDYDRTDNTYGELSF
jgi:type II secretory pathway pseudopilin PulG